MSLQILGNIRQILILLLCGFCLALMFIYSPGGLFIFFVVFLLLLAGNYFLPKEDKSFLFKIFIIGFLIRLGLLLCIHLFFAAQDKWTYFYSDMRAISFMGDSSFFTVRGWFLERFLSGEELSKTVINSTFNPYGFSAHLFLLSLFYYYFGFSPISVILLNCIFSILTGVVYYYIAKRIFNVSAAKFCSFLIVFSPSLVIWSLTNMKDSLFIFLSALISYFFIKFIYSKKIACLFLFILISYILETIRKGFFYPMLMIGFISWLIEKKKTKYIIISVLFVFLAAVLMKFDLKRPLYGLISYHRGVIYTGGLTYRIFDNWVYKNGSDISVISNLELIKGFLYGWFHFILEPFPWKAYSKYTILVSGQVVLWYFLLFFSWIGARSQIRINKKVVFFALYFFVFGSVLALTGGNIGTDFRLRDLLTPIVILFASIGFYKVFDLKIKEG
jgi:4-amino-4-deoxy-L-arabinose transferase-like glycosyltransferase